MLQIPSKEKVRLLEHANFIDNLPPEKFSMTTWGVYAEPRCVCGWFMHNHGRMDKSNWVDAADMMGMDRQSAAKMFSQHIRHIDNKMAAKALRNYAVTGEFNGW